MSSSLNLAYFLRGSRGGFCRWKRIDRRRKEDRDRHGKRERYIYIYIKDQEQRAGRRGSLAKNFSFSIILPSESRVTRRELYTFPSRPVVMVSSDR